MVGSTQQDRGTQASNNPFDPAQAAVPPPNIAELKKLRTNARRKITATCNQISRSVLERGSRGGIRALVQAAKDALVMAGQYEDQLSEEPDAGRQYENHLRYIELMGKVTEEVDHYLADRADEPASVVGQQVGEIERQDDLIEQPAPPRENTAERRVAEAVVGNNTPSLADPEIDEVNRLLRLHHANIDRAAPIRDDRIAAWCRQQQQFEPSAKPILQDSAPDAWIDLYYTGHLPPNTWQERGPRSSVSADLEPFTGKSLEWFGWVDLFRALVHDTGKAPGEKLAILKRSLKGECANVVYGLGGGEEAYGEALMRLKETYGRRDVMRAAHLQAIERLDIGRQDAAAFRRFAEKVRTHLFDLSRIGETATADIIERVCLKLHPADRLAWNSCRPFGLETRSLVEFGAWLCSRAAAYQNAYSIAAEQHNATQLRAVPPKNQFARSNKSSVQTSTDQREENPRATGPFCFRCEGNHRLESCRHFQESSVRERVNFCVRHRLCFSCLGARHSSRSCQSRRPCGSSGCSSFHHALLHDTSSTASTSDAGQGGREQLRPQADPLSQPDNQPRTGRSNVARRDIYTVALGVMRLEAVGPDGTSAMINVMFDEGSDTTLIREGLAQHLKLGGQSRAITVDGVGGANVRYMSRRVGMRLRAANGELIPIEGSTLSTVTKSVPVTDWGRMKHRWEHLTDLPLQSSGGRVDILLGLEQAHLMVALETRSGEEDEPIATRTRLGWLVRGVLQAGGISARIHAAFTSVGDDLLAAAIRRFCEGEEFGTEFQAGCLSHDDQRAIRLLEEGVKRLDRGYEAPITWKEGEPDLPDNRPLAENRFKGLLRRFGQDEAFENDYRAAMEKNFTQGYAVVVEPSNSSDKSQYLLSHHGVRKGPKLRVVFDAAAKFRGKSLNGSIISGPALQTPLAAVLIRFQEGEIAWAADIEAMFSRIRLREDDARYFRFLWKRKGEDRTLLCEMRRLPFGATCSPFIAISVLKKTASDSGANAIVREATEKRFYVDDYLSSSKTIAQGVEEASGVRNALEGGDFHLQGWLSNSWEFLKRIGVKPAASDGGVGLSLDGDDAEKILGIMWNPSTDCIGFKVTASDTVSYTRIGLISKVAGVFDPQGLAAPLTVKAKIQLRVLGVRGMDLSESVTGDDRIWWEQWFRALKELGKVWIPRCLFPKEDNIVTTELHTFGDASQEAFAAVVYLRQLYLDGTIGVHLVKAATKLAPKNVVSIPRMELNASLLAARLARTVEEALTKKVHRKLLWTDSSTVRNWIRTPAASYQVYVANRIGEIQSLTRSEEWRFVPGKLNPADAATRSAFDGEAVIPSVWLYGPEFLGQPEDTWPTDLP